MRFPKIKVAKGGVGCQEGNPGEKAWGHHQIHGVNVDRVLSGQEVGAGMKEDGCQGGPCGAEASAQANQMDEFPRVSGYGLEKAQGLQSSPFIDGDARVGWNGCIQRITDSADGHEGDSCQCSHLSYGTTLHIDGNGPGLFEEGSLLRGGTDDSWTLDDSFRVEVEMFGQPGAEAFMPHGICEKGALVG